MDEPVWFEEPVAVAWIWDLSVGCWDRRCVVRLRLANVGRTREEAQGRIARHLVWLGWRRVDDGWHWVCPKHGTARRDKGGWYRAWWWPSVPTGQGARMVKPGGDHG